MLISVLGALTAYGSISTDMYLPALPSISAAFATPPERAQATLGAYFLGFALGMLVIAPLSDRIGRRRLLIGGIILYIVASAACTLAPSIDVLIAFRFVQALGGGVAAVLARAIVRDLWPPHEGGRVLSFMLAVSMLAPLLTPSLGALILRFQGWQGIFAFLGLFSLLTLVGVLLWVPESLPPQRRSSQSVMQIVGTYLMLMRHRRNLFYLMMVGGAYGGIFTYATGGPFVLIDHYGISPQIFAQFYALGIAGMAVAAVLSGIFVRRLGTDLLLTVGCTMALLAGGSAFALSSVPSIYTLVFPAVLFVMSVGFIYGNAAGAQMGMFPQAAGAAAGLMGAVQFGSGVIANTAVRALHDGTPWATGVCLAVSGIISFFGLVGIWWTRPQKK